MDDGEGPFAVGPGPILFEEFLGVFSQAARRRDRIPSDHARAAEDESESRGLVAVDQNLAFGGVQPFQAMRQVAGQVGLGPFEAGFGRADVDLRRLGLAPGKFLADRRADFVHLDPADVGDDADVNHVDHFPLFVAKPLVFGVEGIGLLDQFLERHAEESDVVPKRGQVVEVGAMNADRPAFELADIVGGGLGVHANEDRRVQPVADVSFGAGSDMKPGGQSFDVRREDVFAAARDSHPVQGAEQDQVGRLTSGTVDRADPDRQVVEGNLGIGREPALGGFCFDNRQSRGHDNVGLAEEAGGDRRFPRPQKAVGVSDAVGDPSRKRGESQRSWTRFAAL